MKKTFFIFAAAAITLAACTKAENGPCTNQENTVQETVPVRIQFDGVETKAAADDEGKINTLRAVLYRIVNSEKVYESYYDFDATKMTHTIYIDPSKEASSYFLAAYANQETVNLASYQKDWSLFSDEKTGDFQMYGHAAISKEIPPTISVPLNRQCSKVSVNKVSLDWTNDANNHKTFKLKSMYLMDAEGVFANVHAIGSSLETNSLWYNKNGYVKSAQDGFLYNAISSVEVKEGTPYTTSHVFYGYISDVAAYNSTATWAPSGTRLVIEAEFDGKASYYAVNVNRGGLTNIRNKHFIFENITITKPGSDTPYGALTVEEDIQVTFSVAEWTEVNHGNVTIQ